MRVARRLHVGLDRDVDLARSTRRGRRWRACSAPCRRRRRGTSPPRCRDGRRTATPRSADRASTRAARRRRTGSSCRAGPAWRSAVPHALGRRVGVPARSTASAFAVPPNPPSANTTPSVAAAPSARPPTPARSGRRGRNPRFRDAIALGSNPPGDPVLEAGRRLDQRAVDAARQVEQRRQGHHLVVIAVALLAGREVRPQRRHLGRRQRAEHERGDRLAVLTAGRHPAPASSSASRRFARA